MKKYIYGVFASFLLAACGGNENANVANQNTTGNVANAEKVLTIAASPTPHAEILAEAANNLKKEGIKLDIKIFDDYVQPNNVVESGEILANYTQHEPYMNQFNIEKGTHLVVAGKIHYEPFGIYPGKKVKIEELSEGDNIAIPNDTTNEARALLLLQDNGLIRLREGAGLTATIRDIVENPKKLELVELEAAQISRVKDQFALVVLNGNYALQAGFNVARDAISFEKSSSTAAKTYVNIIGVKKGNENNPLIQALVKELKSQQIKDFIKNKYNGAVVSYEE